MCHANTQNHMMEQAARWGLCSPTGTVGSRMAGTWYPAANNCLLSSNAAASLPTIRGMMGLTTGTPRRVRTTDISCCKCCCRQGSLYTNRQHSMHCKSLAGTCTGTCALRHQDRQLWWVLLSPMALQTLVSATADNTDSSEVRPDLHLALTMWPSPVQKNM